MSEQHFAIIGCGKIATRHAEQIVRKGKLVAACDIVPARVREFSENYDATSYFTIDSLLSQANNFDLAVVCTPNGLHAQHSIACLRAGLHVICEKPMALTQQDCQAMIAAGEEADKKLFIVKQNRFNPPVVAVKKKIETGAFGKIFNVQLNCFWNREASYYTDNWRGTKDLDGGTLFTQFSHFIDLLYWLLGDVAKVQSYRGNFQHKDNIEFEDTGVVILKFKTGALGTINYTVNAVDKNMEGSLTIFGEKATVKIGGQYLNTLEYSAGIDFGEVASSRPANSYGDYTGSMSNHDLFYDHILDVMDGKVENVLSTFDAMKAVEVIQRIYQT